METEVIKFACWYSWPNTETEVTIDIVPNVKKQHEVHVGMF